MTKLVIPTAVVAMIACLGPGRAFAQQQPQQPYVVQQPQPVYVQQQPQPYVQQQPQPYVVQQQQPQPVYVQQQQYAPQGPRVIRNYDEGAPIPPGYHPETRARLGLVVGGAALFGVFYLFTAIGAGAAIEVQAAEGTKQTGTSDAVPPAFPFWPFPC